MFASTAHTPKQTNIDTHKQGSIYNKYSFVGYRLQVEHPRNATDATDSPRNNKPTTWNVSLDEHVCESGPTCVIKLICHTTLGLDSPTPIPPLPLPKVPKNLCYDSFHTDQA